MAIPRALTEPDPAARSSASVVRDRIRVTVLTDRLLRLEYAADGVFEDRGTVAVVNRRFPVPRFDVTDRGNGLVVDTGKVALRITDTRRAMSRSTTSARIGRGRAATTWCYGDRARGNLGGTTRTLDNCRGREVRELIGLDDAGDLVFSDWKRWDVDPGLLSRDGWVVVDDTSSPVMDPGAGRTGAGHGRGWPTERPVGRRQDLYLFGYGSDHRGALADAASLLGPQPLPPRYALGYWYSRFHAYTDRELLGIVDQFDSMGVPLDVLVVDMDWHLPGWTGYSWDHRYFPDPTDTLRRLHANGVRVTLNVHPADGVGPHEDAYAAVCNDLGVDPATGVTVRFDPTDPGFVESYFTRLHHPEEDRGVDFWWMDWQQGTTSSIEGLDPLPWLNELHWTDQHARDPERRPLVFSRWGGLGGGRFPIGFSGDTWSTWDSLALQPWFTATAANVGYGYWSHDIGGHYGSPPDPEMYARWVQFGAHSPILRTHATKDPEQERCFWEFPEPYRSAMIDAVRRRYELVPYLYGQCREAVETGVSAIRPMYHDHPDRPSAYDADGQYLFGDSFIVAPVVQPVDEDSMARAQVWLPKGRWYDTALGQSLVVRAAAGEGFERRYLLSEVPVFAADGAVVAGQVGAHRLDAACYPHLSITAYPGSVGAGSLYEDDGMSSAYLSGSCVRVALSQRTTATTRTVRLARAKGDYEGWVRHRPVDFRVVAEAVPSSVRLDGHDVPMATAADGTGAVPPDGNRASTFWWYDAAAASVVVHADRIDLRAGATLTLRRDGSLPRSTSRLLDGYPGIARRIDVVAKLLGQVSPPYQLHPDERLAVDLSQSASRITRDPTSMLAELRRTRSSMGHLQRVLAEFEEAWGDAVALLFPEQRVRSVATVARARSLLDTTAHQFGLN